MLIIYFIFPLDCLPPFHLPLRDQTLSARLASGIGQTEGCKLQTLKPGQVTAERVAAVSRTVSGASMLRSADLLCR